MNKFCTQCGAAVTETQKFCNKCGLRLAPTSPTEPAAATQPQQAAGTNPSSQYAPGQYAPGAYPPPPGQMPGQMPYQSGYTPAPQMPPFGGAGVGGLTPNLIGALCYLLAPITSIIFLVLDPYNKDRFVRFHAWQAILFILAWIAAKIIIGIMYIALPDFLVNTLSLVLSIGFFGGWIWLIVQAYQNRMEKLPVIGDLAEQQQLR